MDIKVITRHAPTNYGSLLQSIATINVIESLGHKCEIIDYRSKYERGLKARFIYYKKRNGGHLSIKEFARSILSWLMDIAANHRFSAMRKKYVAMTPDMMTTEQLSELQADAFVTGSDQVWGPASGGDFDPAYFLNFVVDRPKLAFAASFGKAKFNDGIIAEYKDLLSSYTAIAVREKSAVDIIESMGFTRPQQVLDPTLLLDSRQWCNIIAPSTKIPSHDYILIYQIHNDPCVGEYARKLGRRLNMPVYRVSPSIHQIFRPGKLKYLPHLDRFIALINGAKLMVTDSFHGTAFAINFNTPLVEILPNNDTGTRNMSILELTGLTDRIVTDFNDLEMPMRPIDFNKVNRIIDEERIKSIKTLREMLETVD